MLDNIKQTIDKWYDKFLEHRKVAYWTLIASYSVGVLILVFFVVKFIKWCWFF